MKKNNSILLSAPYIAWMLAFTLIPLGVVVYYAFTDPATGAFTFENMNALSAYVPVLWDSIWYALVSALICLLLGYPVAYFIAHRSEAVQKFLYMLVMLPMCMSFLLRTLAWVGLLQDTGIINDFLDLIGIGRLQLIRTPGAVILGMVYNYLPYMILPLYAIIVKIDNRLIEAAEDLGCTPTQTFLRVVLPLSMPGILSGFDQPAIQLYQGGIQRQDHVGQIVINHAQHHCCRGADQLQPTDADGIQNIIDDAGILQQTHPCQRAQQEAHAHRQHHQHIQQLLCHGAPMGNVVSHGIAQQQADQGRDQRIADGLAQHRQIHREIFDILPCKYTGFRVG